MAMVGAQDGITRTARYGVLVAFSLFCLFPFLWMIDTAFKPTDEVLSTTPSFIIRHPTLHNFATVLLHSPFLIYLRNSVIVSGFSTLLMMISSIFCAYVLSRWPRQRPVRVLAGALLASQMIPGVLLLVPLYMTMRDLGLLSTYLSLILVYCTFMVPLAVFMLRGFFELGSDGAGGGGGTRRLLARGLSRQDPPAIVGAGIACHWVIWVRHGLERIHVRLRAHQ